MRPTLLSSCARAATASEARFRIDYAAMVPRSSRVISLDEGAAALVQGLARKDWLGGHFLFLDHVIAGNGSGQVADALLRDARGAVVPLSSELDGADVAVMIATTGAPAQAAEVVGNACALRGIMSAGLVIAEAVEPDAARDVIAALRPNAMVLVVLRDSGDVSEILTALRV